MDIKRIKNHELLKRVVFTLFTILVYIIGRNIILTGVDVAAYAIESFDAQNILDSIVGSNKNQYSLFALGVMPTITVSLVAYIVFAILGKEFREHISKIKYDNIMLFGTLIYSAILAIVQVGSIKFAFIGIDKLSLQKIDCFELILGAMIVYFLTKANTDYGIGGSMPIILFNIGQTMTSMFTNVDEKGLMTVIPLSIIFIAITLFMEYKTVKLPVQRVSIHNEYAKDSYIEFKYNPVGTMPTMFAISFFAIPQVIVFVLLDIFPENEILSYLASILNVNNTIGIIIYLCIIFILTFVFSFSTLLPNDMADNLRRSGDSIVGVYAGKKTNRYLNVTLIKLCILSGVISCAMMGLSLFFAIRGNISAELALFPSTLMILVGNLTSIIVEVVAYGQYDAYKFDI